jgi:hypothetical protein
MKAAMRTQSSRKRLGGFSRHEQLLTAWFAFPPCPIPSPLHRTALRNCPDRYREHNTPHGMSSDPTVDYSDPTQSDTEAPPDQFPDIFELPPIDADDLMTTAELEANQLPHLYNPHTLWPATEYDVSLGEVDDPRSDYAGPLLDASTAAMDELMSGSTIGDISDIPEWLTTGPSPEYAGAYESEVFVPGNRFENPFALSNVDRAPLHDYSNTPADLPGPSEPLPSFAHHTPNLESGLDVLEGGANGAEPTRYSTGARFRWGDVRSEYPWLTRTSQAANTSLGRRCCHEPDPRRPLDQYPRDYGRRQSDEWINANPGRPRVQTPAGRRLLPYEASSKSTSCPALQLGAWGCGIVSNWAFFEASRRHRT